MGHGEKLEIFIDPTHTARLTRSEALGLGHLAFEVDDVEEEWDRLMEYKPESIRINEDGRKFFYVKDPDGVPIEMKNH